MRPALPESPQPVLVVSFAIGLSLLTFSSDAVARTFTSTDGKSIEAEVVTVTETSVVLSRGGGANVTVPLERLSAPDNAFLKEWAENEKKNHIPKVVVRPNPNKREKKQEGALQNEDRQGEFQFEIYLENQERTFEIKDASATLIVLGLYLYTSGEGVVMQRMEFNDINIPPGKNTQIEGDLVRFEYDDKDIVHGEKYDGFLFVFRNAEGKVIDISGSTPRFENAADAILKLRQDEHFDAKSFKGTTRGGSIRR